MIIKKIENQYGGDYPIAFKKDPNIPFRKMEKSDKILVEFTMRFKRLDNFLYATEESDYQASFDFGIALDKNEKISIVECRLSGFQSFYNKRLKLGALYAQLTANIISDYNLKLIEFIHVWKSLIYSDNDEAIKDLLSVEDILE